MLMNCCPDFFLLELYLLFLLFFFASSGCTVRFFIQTNFQFGAVQKCVHPPDLGGGGTLKREYAVEYAHPRGVGIYYLHPYTYQPPRVVPLWRLLGVVRGLAFPAEKRLEVQDAVLQPRHVLRGPVLVLTQFVTSSFKKQ